MTENYVTGSNNIVQSVYCVVNDLSQTGNLHKKVLLKSENCSSENMNSFFKACRESLVLLNFFDEVDVSLILVGNTQSDKACSKHLIDGRTSVTCLRKASIEDSFCHMKCGAYVNVHCFSSALPNIQDSPREVLTSHSDYNEVTSRINSK